MCARASVCVISVKRRPAHMRRQVGEQLEPGSNICQSRQTHMYGLYPVCMRVFLSVCVCRGVVRLRTHQCDLSVNLCSEQ